MKVRFEKFSTNYQMVSKTSGHLNNFLSTTIGVYDIDLVYYSI